MILVARVKESSCDSSLLEQSLQDGYGLLLWDQSGVA